MTGYDASAWSDFALAQLDASAALLGLVFVGLSINLRDVIGSATLVNRAAARPADTGSFDAAAQRRRSAARRSSST